MPQAPFTINWLAGRSKDQSPQKLVNCYAQPETQGSKTKYSVIGTPGTSVFVDLSSFGNYKVRGMHTTASGQLFVFLGPLLIEVTYNSTTASYEATQRGPVLGSSATTQVSACDNGKYIFWADGYVLRAWDFLNDAVAAPQYSGVFNLPTTLNYQNGRVVVNVRESRTDANQFFWSDLGIEGNLTFDALSFATAESSADKIRAISKRQGDLWIFGPRSYEVWANSSNPDLPYQFVGGSASEIGLQAKDSVATIANQVFWLGSSNAGSNQVFMSEGTAGAKIISNPAITYELSQLSTTTDAVGFAYQEEGHIFYVLNILGADKTFVYDATTGLWHERQTRLSDGSGAYRWRPTYATYAFDRVIVGNSDAANILELSLNTYEEYDSTPIIREIISPVYWNENKRLIHREFQVEMETGTSLQTGQGSNAVMRMSYSDDGGHTFSSWDTAEIGKIGQYQARVRFQRLGSSYERVYRISVSDPVKFFVLGASITAESTGYR